MALITRLSRLFQADMHAVLDKIEEPELLLKQAIREMESSIEADERQIRCWELERKQLANKHDQLGEDLSDLEGKLALCFQANKEDLARSLIKRKLETQQATQLLADKLTVLKEKSLRLSKQLAEHQTQLAGMKQKADIFMNEDKVGVRHWENPSVSIKDEDVEVAFLYEKQKWSGS